jgi:peroxiredoxin
MVEVGEKAPDFILRSHKGEEVSLGQYLKEGKNVILSVHVASFTAG